MTQTSTNTRTMPTAAHVTKTYSPVASEEGSLATGLCRCLCLCRADSHDGHASRRASRRADPVVCH
eukprot:CAMPEP_0182801750 /NCGR_PEP_ID=MMETSP0006_2-20121128/3117_1 /TAXON_ID=97485 /ORGANISM="Prymnesium parvum, Strain Texoma1" /LENGTH=65 /DNA_ID=CAMNT_0024927089 /DNA_START=541 /DNA_END=738 /DNA_ORIENTATION=+